MPCTGAQETNLSIGQGRTGGRTGQEEEEAIVPFTGASCPNRGGHIGLPCTVAQETSL